MMTESLTGDGFGARFIDSILDFDLIHPFIFSSFFQLVGDLSELRDKKYGDVNGRDLASEKAQVSQTAKEYLRIFAVLSLENICIFITCKCVQVSETAKEYMDVTLDDLEVIATLGVGGFGRVELVKVMILIIMIMMIMVMMTVII